MGIALNNQAATTIYGTGSIAADLDVAAEDLIVVKISTLDNATYCTGVSDDFGNTWVVRTAILANYQSFVFAYCLSSIGASGADTITATFNNANAGRKNLIASSWTPDAGDTVTLDDSSPGSSTWAASPWSTTANDLNTTGDDELVIGGFQGSAAKTFTNHEIPSGTAAAALSSASDSDTVFYRLLTATLSNGEAEVDVSAGGSFCAEVLAFKSTAGGGNDALTADPITSGAPALGAPSVSQIHALTGSVVSAGAPALGTPTLTQNHAISGNGSAAGAPVLGTPSLMQTHALTGNGLAAGAPALGTPSVSQTHALTASGITITPVLGMPTLHQDHALMADGISTTPQISSPTITQLHILTGSGIVTGAPVLGTPALTENGGEDFLTASDLTASAAVLGEPLLAQIHQLVATGIIAGPPVLDSPWFINPIAPPTRVHLYFSPCQTLSLPAAVAGLALDFQAVTEVAL